MATGATEHDLERGYGRSTPPGDNLCHDFIEHYADSMVALTEAAGNRFVVDDTVDAVMVDNASATPFINPVVLRRPLTRVDADILVERAGAFYHGHPGGPYGVWSVYPTPDLRTHGLFLAGHPPLML